MQSRVSLSHKIHNFSLHKRISQFEVPRQRSEGTTEKLQDEDGKEDED